MNKIKSVGVAPEEAEGVLPATGRLSVAVSVFLAEKSAELSPYSVTHLRTSLTRMARALDDPPLTAVTYNDLRAYSDNLYLKYKPGTIKSVIGDIRQFWRWCKRRRLVKRNPAKRLKMPSRRVVENTSESRSAPEDGVQRLIGYLTGLLSEVVYRDLFGNLCPAALDEWTYETQLVARDLFILVLIYETGARSGEVRTLGSRAMEEAIAAPGPVFRVVVTGKTGGQVLRFTQATAELWCLWRDVRPRGCGEYAVVSWHNRLSDPTPIVDRTTISGMLARRCRQAGIPVFRAHALRHAKVKRGKAAVGVEATSRLLGHSSTAVTERYGAADDDELADAAARTGLQFRLWT